MTPLDRHKIYADIDRERDEQDQRFGGPIHDDSHSPSDWISFIRKHATQCMAEVRADSADYRYELVRIAALAVAAIEAHDRRHWNDIAGDVAEALFTNGNGDQAARLVLELADKKNGGGWCQQAAVDRIREVLRKMGQQQEGAGK